MLVGSRSGFATTPARPSKLGTRLEEIGEAINNSQPSPYLARLPLSLSRSLRSLIGSRYEEKDSVRLGSIYFLLCGVDDRDTSYSSVRKVSRFC